jgi:drug/metabolite transporter (DMT)-like permease
LFYLVPPLTALEAYILFDEQFEFLALCGGVMSVMGVALVLVTKQHETKLG